MIIPFGGVQTIGAASQPAFGSTMNGAGTLQTDPHTNNTKPGSQNSVSVLPMTSVVGFKTGQQVAVGPKANFVYQGSLDTGIITAVGANSITVNGLKIAHASGEYVLLNEDVSSVVIVPGSGNTGAVYIGTDSTVSPTDPTVFDEIFSTYFHLSATTAQGNTYKTTQYWIDGTVADTFIARYTQV